MTNNELSEALNEACTVIAILIAALEEYPGTRRPLCAAARVSLARFAVTLKKAEQLDIAERAGYVHAESD